MATTENKLELLRQLRMEQDANLRDMQQRENILYGKSCSYAAVKTGEPMPVKNPAMGIGVRFLFRCILTILLCTGFYYVVHQEKFAEEDTVLLLELEQTEKVKEVMGEWLTKNDLSFEIK